MHSLLFLLAPFIAFTSAIDIRIHYENNGKCNNSNYISCRNMNPNDCCVTPSGPKTDQAQAFGFAAIPTNWNIHSKAYTARGCPGNRVKNDFWSGGRRDMCHGTNINNFAEYMSASYSFGQRKMANGDDGEAPKVREPDVMFIDGAQYDLAAMDEKSVIYMYELLANGTDAVDVPTQFDEFKQE